MKKIMFRNLILVLLIVFTIASCKKPAGNPSFAPLSIAYRSAFADSASSGRLPEWRTLFVDTLLTNLIDTALNSNPDLKMAAEKMEIAGAGILQARGDLMPKLSLAPGAAIRRFGLYTMDGAGNIATEITPGKIVPINLPDFFLGGNFSWEVDLWGKLKNQRKAAHFRFLASREGKHLIQTQLIFEIASGYYRLSSLDEQREMVLRLIRKQEEALEIIRNLKEGGRTNELAVQQFLAQLYQLRGIEPIIRQETAEIENQMNFLIGRPPGKIIRRMDPKIKLSVLISDSSIPAYVLERRPDILMAKLELEASGFDVEAARAAFLPALSLNGLLGTQAFTPGFLANLPASLAYATIGTLAAPVFNRNGLKAQLKTARASQLLALEAYRKAVAISLAEISTELNRQKHLEESIALKQKEQEILDNSVSTSAELLKYGKANYLEVLNAQQRLMNANSEFIELGFQKKLCELSLYRALGGGW